MIEKHTYDTNYYPLRMWFRHMVIGSFELEMLHTLDGFEEIGDKPGSDNNSKWHSIFYDKMRGSDFMDCYDMFMLNKIRPKFSESIVYQQYPTLRIQPPNGKGVAAYHIDSEYNHPVEEMNIWLPLTHAFGSASIYIESEPGKGDYMPQDVKYGEYITFEGGKLSHGNEINNTGKTRVSIDMRVIPFSKFTPSKLKGLAYGKVRDIGDENSYYSIIK